MNKAIKHFRKNMMLLAPVFALVLSFFFASNSFALVETIGSVEFPAQRFYSPYSGSSPVTNVPYYFTYYSNRNLTVSQFETGYVEFQPSHTYQFTIYFLPRFVPATNSLDINVYNKQYFLNVGGNIREIYEGWNTVTFDGLSGSIINLAIKFDCSYRYATASATVPDPYFEVQGVMDFTYFILHDLGESVNQDTNDILMEQNKLLTDFSRKDEMSSNSSTNGSIMGDYTESEDAVVSGAHDGLSKFDFLAPFKFAAGLSQSVLLCSTWLSDLIAAMGDFSFIFTLGSALTIVICIFVGLSRFKRGG